MAPVVSGPRNSLFLSALATHHFHSASDVPVALWTRRFSKLGVVMPLASAIMYNEWHRYGFALMSDNLTHIEQSPQIRSGRPHLRGTRISVDDVVILHLRLGLGIEQIVGKYQLEPAAVHAALAYYYDHREEIDRQIAQDDAFVEAFRRNHPSPLQERLHAITR